MLYFCNEYSTVASGTAHITILTAVPIQLPAMLWMVSTRQLTILDSPRGEHRAEPRHNGNRHRIIGLRENGVSESDLTGAATRTLAPWGCPEWLAAAVPVSLCGQQKPAFSQRYKYLPHTEYTRVRNERRHLTDVAVPCHLLDQGHPKDRGPSLPILQVIQSNSSSVYRHKHRHRHPEPDRPAQANTTNKQALGHFLWDRLVVCGLWLLYTVPCSCHPIPSHLIPNHTIPPAAFPDRLHRDTWALSKTCCSPGISPGSAHPDVRGVSRVSHPHFRTGANLHLCGFAESCIEKLRPDCWPLSLFLFSFLFSLLLHVIIASVGH